MIHYIKLALQFDADRMKQELQALTAIQWPMHYQTRHFEGEWSALSLRSIDGQSGNVLVSPIENAIYQDTELLQKTPYIKEVLQQFNCPLEAVRLLKLTPGSVIREHKDADLCYEKGAIRLHIPIQTNPAVEFKLDGEQLIMQEGECWYCNFNRTHALANHGHTDRIHLVIDAQVNDWVERLFSGDQVVLKKEVPEEQLDEKTKKEMIHHLRMLNTPTSNQLADEMEASPPSASSQE